MSMHIDKPFMELLRELWSYSLDDETNHVAHNVSRKNMRNDVSSFPKTSLEITQKEVLYPFHLVCAKSLCAMFYKHVMSNGIVSS